MIRFIVPAPYDLVAEQRAIDEALRAGIAIAQEMFRQATQTWEPENQPAWEYIPPHTNAGARVAAYTTTSTPFVWVDAGTRKDYPIAPVNARFLVFRAGFVPKTRKRTLPARTGGSFGPLRFAKLVIHPGIEPREFSDMVAEHLSEVLARDVPLRIRRAR